MARGRSKAKSGVTELGYEAQLWKMADALRNNMDAAEYKHVVLGLIFLKYISDAFEAKHAKLETQRASGADPEDPDEYRAASIFWVPREARWSHLKASAPQPTIGTIVDDAMAAIERDNPSLKGVLPKDYARPNLDKQRLGQLSGMVSNIALGDEASRAKDRLAQAEVLGLEHDGGGERAALLDEGVGDLRLQPLPELRPADAGSGRPRRLAVRTATGRVSGQNAHIGHRNERISACQPPCWSELEGGCSCAVHSPFCQVESRSCRDCSSSGEFRP
ncbi:MAG: type I restriction-modification system subunit M N-terminal domain-containing protein [Rhodocyclaceae bacterium]|nr:type I restriction-modification system subunit M N-terminal domain-containing protein [Rhodocyclaceae bacterium]